MNILNKIYCIMDEYDYLLNINNNLKDDDIDDITDNDIINNKNELSQQFNDGFFKYIFDNINLTRRNNENNYSNESFEEQIDVNKNIQISDISYMNNSNNTNNDKYNDNNYTDDNDINNGYDKINNNEEYINNIEEEIDNKEDNIILDFIKKIYKKIIIKCHPDKGGDKSLFIKCQEYYDNKFLIGILYIGYKVNFILPELNNTIIEHILYEIRIIQHKIIYMKLKFKKNVNK